MARNRAFDEREVLLQAMRVFWANGYERTSLADLLTATGLSKSSLYASFGDKRDLFLAAFERYRQERMRRIASYLSSEDTAYASIEAFFRMVADQVQQDEKPFGCMSCNEAIEFGPHDAEVQAIIEQDLLGIEDALAAAVARGQADGSISGSGSARMLARGLTVMHQGLQVMARSGVEFARLDDAVTVALATLRLPAGSPLQAAQA